MADVLRMEMPRAGDDRRWFVGVTVSARCHEIAGALIAARGRGLEARVDVVGHSWQQGPREGVLLFQQLVGQTASPPFETLVELRAILAAAQATLVGQLLESIGVGPRVLAAGVCDPGWWMPARPGWIYASLCDATRLAEATGITVLDAFPSRDIAQGGQGGPLQALGQWLLLADRSHRRVLLDLGRTTRLSYLPAGDGHEAVDSVVSFEVGPGTGLLDQLAYRFSGGKSDFDPGGRLAVQGQRIPELLEHWLRDPYFERSLPRWQPCGVRPERFLTDAMNLAVRNGWSVRDLLCTATHLIAESIARAAARRLPAESADAEFIVAGGGQHNGMLLREIAGRTDKQLARLGDVLPQPDALEPACAAVLAMLYLDQTPANLPACTGASQPRLLGRITPGAPANWQRVVQTMADSQTTARPLRAAQ